MMIKLPTLRASPLLFVLKPCVSALTMTSRGVLRARVSVLVVLVIVRVDVLLRNRVVCLSPNTGSFPRDMFCLPS